MLPVLHGGPADALEQRLPLLPLNRPDHLHTCHEVMKASWKPLEKWIWERICLAGDGSPIDIDKYFTKQPSQCSEKRVVTPEFLKQMLTDKDIQARISNFGIRLRGLTVNRVLDVSSTEIKSEVVIESSCFKDAVILRSAVLHRDFSLSNSVFYRGLDMSYIRSYAAIHMPGVRIVTLDKQLQSNDSEPDAKDIRGRPGYLDLRSSDIASNIVIDRARAVTLNMNSLKAGGYIALRGSSIYYVNLIGAEIGNLQILESNFTQLNMDQATVKGSVRAEDTVFVDRTLDEKQRQQVGDIFDDEFVLNKKARVQSALIMRSASVDGHVQLDRAVLSGIVDLANISVGGILDLGGGVIVCGDGSKPPARCVIKLQNMQVQKEVRLYDLWVTGSPRDQTQCAVLMGGSRIGGRLTLQNSNMECLLNLQGVDVGQLQLKPKEWRYWKYLVSGLQYNNIEMDGRDVGEHSILLSWVLGHPHPEFAWLRQQPNPIQPYHQLSSVLKADGDVDTAKEILFASRFRLFLRSCGAERQGLSIWSCFWDGAQFAFIGLGYYTGFVIPWILVFVVAGTAICARTGRKGSIRFKGSPRKLTWWATSTYRFNSFLYSLDCLLPIVDIDPRHRDIILQGWPKSYFVFHRLMGYVLALFLVASITGLTK